MGQPMAPLRQALKRAEQISATHQLLGAALPHQRQRQRVSPSITQSGPPFAGTELSVFGCGAAPSPSPRNRAETNRHDEDREREQNDSDDCKPPVPLG